MANKNNRTANAWATVTGDLNRDHQRQDRGAHHETQAGRTCSRDQKPATRGPAAKAQARGGAGQGREAVA